MEAKASHCPRSNFCCNPTSQIYIINIFSLRDCENHRNKKSRELRCHEQFNPSKFYIRSHLMCRILWNMELGEFGLNP